MQIHRKSFVSWGLTSNTDSRRIKNPFPWLSRGRWCSEGGILEDMNVTTKQQVRYLMTYKLKEMLARPFLSIYHSWTVGTSLCWYDCRPFHYGFAEDERTVRPCWAFPWRGKKRLLEESPRNNPGTHHDVQKSRICSWSKQYPACCAFRQALQVRGRSACLSHALSRMTHHLFGDVDEFAVPSKARRIQHSCVLHAILLDPVRIFPSQLSNQLLARSLRLRAPFQKWCHGIMPRHTETREVGGRVFRHQNFLQRDETVIARSSSEAAAMASRGGRSWSPGRRCRSAVPACRAVSL